VRSGPLSGTASLMCGFERRISAFASPVVKAAGSAAVAVAACCGARAGCVCS
jgi:hypothetical protein